MTTALVRQVVFARLVFTRLIFTLFLLGFAFEASARDRYRDYDGAWKLGHGRDYYSIYHFNGRGWQRMPGSATAVGDGWVIGTDRRGGGYGIYRWSGRSWQRVPGGAVSIGGSYEQPWVINDRGEQFHWNGHDWDKSGRSDNRYLRDLRRESIEDHYYNENSRRRLHDW